MEDNTDSEYGSGEYDPCPDRWRIGPIDTPEEVICAIYDSLVLND